MSFFREVDFIYLGWRVTPPEPLWAAHSNGSTSIPVAHIVYQNVFFIKLVLNANFGRVSGIDNRHVHFVCCPQHVRALQS